MDNYHEIERVILRGDNRQSRTGLHLFLKKNGFQAVDDSYKFRRCDRVYPWQSLNLLKVDVALNGSGVYETEEDVEEGSSTEWDSLICSYVMASLPCECVDSAVTLMEAIANKFDLRAFVNEKQMAICEVMSLWRGIAADLAANYAPAGSEELAILIESNYPRR